MAEPEKKQNSIKKSCLNANSDKAIVRTFCNKKDGINRDKEIHAFAELLNSIEIEKDDNEERGNVVIAIDGEWGCGKSFFVQHTILFCKNYLNAEQNQSYENAEELYNRCRNILKSYGGLKPNTVDAYLYYDAWKNDAFGGDPMLSILYNTLPEEQQQKCDILKNARETTGKFRGSISVSAGVIGGAVSTPTLEELWGVFKKKVKEEYDEVTQRSSIYTFIRTVLKGSLEKRGKERFIIFIDELDRCNPRFAVKVLERVKHFFDNPNLVFVFSVNLDQLQHTIKEVYGQNFDAMNYLHRFFDYQITLSTPDMEQFVGDKLNFIVEEADAIRDSARYAIESYELSIRDTIRYIDALKIVYYSICAELKKRLAEQREDVADTEQPAYRFVLEVIAPSLLGQKIADADRYNTIVSQRKVQEYDKKPLFKERITNYLTTRNIKYAEYLDPSIVREGQKNLLEESVAEKAYDSIFPLNQKQDLPWGKKYKLTRATRRSLLSIMGGLAPQKKSDSQDIWEYTGKRAPRAGEIMTPRAGEIMTIRIENVDFHFVYCPAGRFTMGSPEEEKGRGVDETQHEVTLTEGFWIGKYEVTQGQYKAITGKNPSHFKGDNRPVEMVFWYESVTFCQKLNRLKIAPRGYMFMFPTEAEWEYACRAGTTTALNSGKPVTVTSEDGECPNLDEVGWYWENSGGQTHPVMEKEPNAWGIYDMHGNVWEWCADKYGDYPKGAVTDPEGLELGVYRVLRGGGWSGIAGICRSALRDAIAPGYRHDDRGFRLVLIPEQKTASP